MIIHAFFTKDMPLSIIILYAILLYSFLLHSYGRDTISISSSPLYDSKGDSLVSSGEKYELGFFTPTGSSGRRYVGIWFYNSNPQAIVWVANRDNPVLDHNGAFSISEDGNLKVIDGNGITFWSTDFERSNAGNKMTKLLDSGNLVVGDVDSESETLRVLWQSFENPTDTFIPGMRMNENMSLISWRSYNDPAVGNFSFQLDQAPNQFVIWRRSVRYWRSGVSSIKNSASSEMPSAVSYFLSNFTSTVINNDSVPHITSSLYSDTRLVMSFSGQIQYLKWDSEKIWSLIWAAPRTRCGLYNACGNFGICNGNNQLECKCLPGFQPVYPEDWNSEDYSGGCSRRSALCSNGNVSDIFVDLKMIKVGNPDSHFNAKSETECKLECLNNCQCQAYSFEKRKNLQLDLPDSTTCWIWSDDLRDLQEEYDDGRNLSLRVSISDIEAKPRSCGICGANIVPYPLSTGHKCGDPTYFNFQCNISSGQLTFFEAGGFYKVTRISPEMHRFAIQIEDADICKTINKSSVFYTLRECNTDFGSLRSDVPFIGVNEVEIGWRPPLEPPCFCSTDCKDWLNSTCNSVGYGKKKCLCDSNFQWDGLNLVCRQEGHYGKHQRGSSLGRIPLAVVILLALVSAILFLVLSCTITCTCLHKRGLARGSRGDFQRQIGLHVYGSQRLIKDIIKSGSFHEDDKKVADVPFFDLESIITATNNFSNANKLGQGGFGPVYKAIFPRGEEIAVKRLSSCSGQGLEEFKNEVMLIAKLQHRNLVRLLGYCLEGEEKMLLYEYMPNKSLDSFIFDRKLRVLLNWEMRYNIIVGIARGLLYLHQDSRLRIIHRDLKTSNILLDEEMSPKISDFGLARTFGGKETSANTNKVVGTYGYIAPEYALDGLFSFKSDVFSFGVVVLEIISGKRNTSCYLPEVSLSLLAYAWNLWKEGKIFNLLDRTLSESYNVYEFQKCVNIGLLCVQEDPSDRPTVSNVLFMLGSETAILPSPKQPPFVLRRCISSSKASSSSKPETCSNNRLTITLEDGR